ncbi:hypothetical protein BpHYR1_024735 [Brachionus plicatilis]|uniref:Uncharacterized protein n=1 Tax=Brachionus plicatilis TaxID=10195 RepID=A0A3M7P984_BRAPC|nr:hypothetical protein BpHYR1_024735 [Brachionus plicatilis]
MQVQLEFQRADFLLPKKVVCSFCWKFCSSCKMLKFSIKNLIENTVSNGVSNSASTAFNLSNILDLNAVKEPPSRLPNPKSDAHSDAFIADSQTLLTNFNEYQKFLLSKFQSSYQSGLLQFQSNHCYQQSINRMWLYRLSQRSQQLTWPANFGPVVNTAAVLDDGSCLEVDRKKRCSSEVEKSEPVSKKSKPVEPVLTETPESKPMLAELSEQKNCKPKTFPCTECGKN